MLVESTTATLCVPSRRGRTMNGRSQPAVGCRGADEIGRLAYAGPLDAQERGRVAVVPPVDRIGPVIASPLVLTSCSLGRPGLYAKTCSAAGGRRSRRSSADSPGASLRSVNHASIPSPARPSRSCDRSAHSRRRRGSPRAGAMMYVRGCVECAGRHVELPAPAPNCLDVFHITVVPPTPAHLFVATTSSRTRAGRATLKCTVAASESRRRSAHRCQVDCRPRRVPSRP